MNHQEIMQKLKLAIISRKSRNYSEAQSILDEIKTLEPNNKAILFEQAVLYRFIKKYDKALEILEILKNYNKRDLALKEMGKNYFALEKYEETIAVFKNLYDESFLLDDSNIAYRDRIDALRYIGNCYMHLNDTKMARFYYVKVLEEKATNPNKTSQDNCLNYGRIANTYLQEGNVSEALKYYNIATQYKNSLYLPTVLINLAELYLNSHDLQEAEDLLNYVLEQSSRLSKETIYAARLTLSKVLILKANENNYDEETVKQIITLLNSLQNTKYMHRAWSELAYFYFKIRKYEKALKILKTTIKMDNKAIEQHQHLQLARIIKDKLGLPENHKSWDMSNYQNYSTSKLIKRLKSHQTYSSTHINESINKLLEDLDLDSSNYYGNDIYDNYYVNIPNIAVIDGIPTDFILVKTLVNSPTFIVDIVPCRSLNNELHKTESKPFIPTLK